MWPDFQNTRFSISRNVFDYSKTQALVGAAIRGRRWFVSRRKRDYLNIGCGPNIFGAFYNLDYAWRPGIDACWDIANGLPFPESQFRGCFSEHCLEHVSLSVFRHVISEVFRVIQPGAYFRIVVPDAEIYLRGYLAELNGDDAQVPYRDPLVEKTALMSVNRIFREHGHLYAWDYRTMKVHLSDVGFLDIRNRKFRDGEDPNLLVDSESRAIESLYVEAMKPRVK